MTILADIKQIREGVVLVEQWVYANYSVSERKL